MKNYWNLRLSDFAIAVALAFIPLVSDAQFSRPEEKFPTEEKYLYPIRPGQPGSLAGTMGELRTTHFHSGIDIRTDNKIGLPVLAAKSGYVSRVTVTPSGYGNVLYITHPDGNTTLYAHLDKFTGKVARHVLDHQYKEKSANVDLHFQPHQFVVKRGDTVAVSGNTGSSGGPHLHFDIRDSNNHALNPLLVEGFSEIVDGLPPYVEKVALKTLDINSRINDQYGRFEFYVQRVGNDFIFPTPILASGNIGIEVLAKDKLAPKSQFWGGVNNIQVAVDEKVVFNQNIEKINIAETRGIYTLMDFKTMRLNGNRFYKLYIDDGNELDFYGKSPSSGKIQIRDRESEVKVTLKDSYGNASNLSLKLRPTALTPSVKFLDPMKSEFEYEVYENTIMLSVPPCSDSSSLKVFYKSNEETATPTYGNENRSVYLIDLRKQFPDSISICGKSITTNIKAMVPPSIEFNYYSDEMDIQFPEKSLYDTVYLTTYHGLNSDSLEVFNIGSRVDPLNKSINVIIRPSQTYDWDSGKYAVYRVAGRNAYSYLGGSWRNGGVHFSSREFGDFTIMKDDTAPTINSVVVNNYIAKFKIRDNLSGINKYEANIDGQWLLMHYDPKTATIWSEQLKKSKALKGKLTLVVTDNSGNETVYTKQIQ